MKLFTVILLLLFFAQAKSDCTTQMKFEGVIGPATVDYFDRGLLRAKNNSCDSVVIYINTPGGNLQSTRLIVEAIINSPIPVLCLVHPSGGHAGSAGAIILLACHVSGAMETTNIGAATPVSGMGEKIPEDLRKKLLNDTRSWVEGLTKLRKRSEKFGQDIITEAKAVEAREALELGAIDFVAKEAQDFLEFANEREVDMTEGKKQKVIVGNLQPFMPDMRHNLVQIITDPQFAYLIFMGSLGLIYFELTHPGTLVPGVIGGIGLVVSLIAFHKLDVWWGGLALLLLGLVFMIAEAFVPSFGALGLGGMAAFVIGSIFLFDPETTGYSLPLKTLLPTAIALGLVTFGLAYLAWNTRKVKKRGAYDDLKGAIGEIVELRSKKGLKGLIDVEGETWKFVSDIPLQIGEEVRVTGNKGLTLRVEKQ